MLRHFAFTGRLSVSRPWLLLLLLLLFSLLRRQKLLGIFPVSQIDAP